MISQNAHMGMFDEVKCDAPFPDERLAPGSWLQTKSLSCCMLRYTITPQGRLLYNRHHNEPGPDREIREGVTLPGYKLIHVEDIDMGYHGDIRLYGNGKDETWLDYVARFTHGALEWIRPYEELSDTHKSWFDS
jgi:hypothetical protein